MSQESQDIETIEETDEDTNLFVVDPDNYQKTKKLESIHKSRRQVRKVRESFPVVAMGKEQEGHKRKLSRTVAQYGSELLPLIEEGMRDGIIEEEDTIAPAHEISIFNFVKTDGCIADDESGRVERATISQSMTVYRQLDRLMRKLGLGLDLEEQKGPAEI